MKRIGYIDGRRIFLADGQALSFGTDKDIAASYNATVDALEFGGNVYLGYNKKIYFGDATVYMNSAFSGGLTIVAPSTRSDAIYLAGNTFIGAHLRISSNNKLEFRNADAYIQSHVSGGIYVFTTAPGASPFYLDTNVFINGQLMVANAKELYLKDTNVWLMSNTSGVLLISATVNVYFYPRVDFGGRIRLIPRTTPGTQLGEMWYLSTDNTLRYFDHTGEKIIATV